MLPMAKVPSTVNALSIVCTLRYLKLSLVKDLDETERDQIREPLHDDIR